MNSKIIKNQEEFLRKNRIWTHSSFSIEENIESVYTNKIRNLLLCVKMRLKMLKFRMVNRYSLPKFEIPKDELVVVSILKNEGFYVKEWIEFYRLLGIDRFYIFNNISEDDTVEKLKPYMDEGYVQLIDIPGYAQLMAYNFAIDFLKGKVNWVMIVDADEFLFPVEDISLKEFLKDYEEFPGLGVNWVVYGPGEHKQRPKGLVIESYTQTFKDRNNELNCRIKSIFHPHQVLCMDHSHTPIYKNGLLAVDENKQKINGLAMYAPHGPACTMNNSISKVRVNHYWTKSLEELENKIAKGRPDACSNLKLQETLDRLAGEKMNDTLIYRYIPQLKENMNEE